MLGRWMMMTSCVGMLFKFDVIALQIHISPDHGHAPREMGGPWSSRYQEEFSRSHYRVEL